MNKNWLPLLVVVLIVGLVGGYGLGSRGKSSPQPLAERSDPSKRFVLVCERVSPAVVHIKTEGRTNASGSGVIVAADGRVLTNHHVIKDARRIWVELGNGKRFPATVLGSDPNTDIAVLQIRTSERLTVAELGSSQQLKVGQWVLAFGNPFGIGQTVTAGIISAHGRAGIGLNEAEDFIQTDAAINPGNSGGPLVDLSGKVIGINTAILTRSGGSQGVGLAIPIEIAQRIMESLEKTGKIYSGYLGIVPEAVEFTTGPLAGRKAVRVAQVVADSPATRADLRVGDIILRYDGSDVGGRRHLLGRIRQGRPGARVTLDIVRGQTRKKLTITVGRRAVK